MCDNKENALHCIPLPDAAQKYGDLWGDHQLPLTLTMSLPPTGDAVHPTICKPQKLLSLIKH